MGNKRRLLLAIVLLAALAACAWFFLSSNQPPEPVYQGKTLTVWLEEGSGSFGQDINSEEQQKAADAVGHIGTNAIPTLLHLLRIKYSPLKTKLILILNNQSYFKIHLTSDQDLHSIAFSGFLILGTNGVSAVPELIHIFEENISVDSQRYALASLGAIGPPAKAAIPLLLKAATNTNYDWRVRYAAVGSVYEIHADPQIAMPAMAICLTDTNPDIRRWACNVLGEFGTNAEPCVPALVSLLKDPNNLVRERAGGALKKIDPEAAAKAGVE
jgi:HEAT repeats/PBS lyase HEAT-like repeat